jgi:hypothetical protein
MTDGKTEPMPLYQALARAVDNNGVGKAFAVR